MEALLASLPGALLIFVLRIGDVSIGTLRVIYMVRGRRMTAAALALVESLIWMFAVSRIFGGAHDPVKMVGYACGFAAGTLIGLSFERLIDKSSIIVRLIVREKPAEMVTALREAGYGVTAVSGEGREGAVQVMFIVAPRKHGDRLIELIQQIEPAAFFTVDPVQRAYGGFIPTVSVFPGYFKK